jgi:membrane protease YdiL (CAAX protease family)
MTGPIVPTSSSSPAPTQAAGNCPYCGAPLHRAFYFCLACATPYQHPDNVVPIEMPLALTEGMLIQRKAPQVATLFWTFFAVIIGTAVLCALIFQDREIGLHILIQSAILFVVTLVFASIHWKSLAVQFKRLGFLQWHPYAALGLLAPLLCVNYLYHGWIRTLAGAEDPLSKLREDQLGMGVMVLLICVVPAILEEIAFRGLVQHWLQTALRPWRAILVASALFTALHFSIVSFPYLFCVGMLLGWTKWKTGSLYPCMLIHFLHNYVVIAYMT